MARLHEFQAKQLLLDDGIRVPRSVLVRTGVTDSAPSFPLPGVVKAQVWTTGRAGKGLIRFADSLEEVMTAVEELGEVRVDGFPVEAVLVEERLEIEHEYFFSYYIDDDAGVARYMLAAVGGSGIEEILAEHPDSVHGDVVETAGPIRVYRIREVVRQCGLRGKDLMRLSDLVQRAIALARRVEARALEINPIARMPSGEFVAADCRITVDDYAVFRHPELGIEIARDLSNPPTELDRIAYRSEASDFRGTFYFTQLAQGFAPEDRYVGFHGAGGGGSMMSMDALCRYDFRPANYCDTSGNPPASKVYRAARIILAQPGIIGYFGSGSGVASQEQVHSARGLVKAFTEVLLSLPAVVRLGGNLEDEAIRILERYTRGLPARVRGFGKDANVTECVAELSRLVADAPSETGAAAARRTNISVSQANKPEWLSDSDTYSFASPTGTVYYHYPTCLECTTQACVASCVPQILRIQNGKPELGIGRREAASGKCIECLACEVECREHGLGGGFVDLPLPEMSDVTARPGEADR